MWGAFLAHPLTNFSWSKFTLVYTQPILPIISLYSSSWSLRIPHSYWKILHAGSCFFLKILPAGSCNIVCIMIYWPVWSWRSLIFRAPEIMRLHHVQFNAKCLNPTKFTAWLYIIIWLAHTLAHLVIKYFNVASFTFCNTPQTLERNQKYHTIMSTYKPVGISDLKTSDYILLYKLKIMWMHFLHPFQDSELLKRVSRTML